jgi:hypothetical protein
VNQEFTFVSHPLRATPQCRSWSTTTSPHGRAQGARAARRRPECIEPLWRRGACPTGAPVLPDRTPVGRGSGLPRRAMGYRRDADLCPRRGRSWPAPAGWVTTEWPAVRVDARGGGRGHRAGMPLRSLCLAQRRELRGRQYGLAHQLAQRALLRAAGGRRGEHVFGRLRMASDGTRTLRGSVRQMARIWLYDAQSGRRNLQPILQNAGSGEPAAWGATARPERTRRRPSCAPCRPPHR